MLQNAANCSIQIFFWEACPRTPLANVWLRHASQAAINYSGMQLAQSCIRSWTTTKKFIRGNALVESTLADS